MKHHCVFSALLPLDKYQQPPITLRFCNLFTHNWIQLSHAEPRGGLMDQH